MMLKKMALVSVCAWMILGGSSFGAGGELGNAFIAFDSKLGEFSLEYPKHWQVNDLSVTANFSENDDAAVASFLAVNASRTGGPESMAELQSHLRKKFPGMDWIPAKLGGLNGLAGEKGDVKMVYLLRAPGDMLSLRFRSTKGESSEHAITHMLRSFRAD